MSSESRGQAVGPWTLHEQLDRGGNGTVWKATRPDAETVVALKVLNVTQIEHESYKRFVRETWSGIAPGQYRCAAMESTPEPAD